MHSINEAFATNMLGRTIGFDVNPYQHGQGTIKKITPRRVKVKEFSLPRGYMYVEYEVFDLVVDCEKGSHTGALICGVPVSGATRDLSGKEVHLIGVRYADILNGSFISATCG